MYYHQDTSNPHHFRCWWHIGKNGTRSIALSFDWWVTFCGVGVDWDDDHGLGFFIGLPPLALWFHLPVRWRLRQDIDIFKIDFHLDCVRWKVFAPSMSWDSSTPKWRDGSFYWWDVLLGRQKCTTSIIEEREVTIPMPERSYAAKAKLMAYRWQRPRWFSKKLSRVEIEIPEGIPFEGKGTAAYNCGPDATFSITTGKCGSIPEGVGILVGSVLQDRVRYGGWRDWSWQRDIAA